MQRNFMNYNEVFPILDLIGRVQNRKKGSPNFSDGGAVVSNGGATFELPVDLRVVKLEVTRDENNPVMPGVIIKLDITYENGATAELDIHRGLQPPVGSDVDEYEFINSVMITGLTMVTLYNGSKETMELTILKEGGYGTLQGVEVKWDGKIVETITVGDEEEGDEPPISEFEPEDNEIEDEDNVIEDEENELYYDNPNDFYNNGETVQDDVVVGMELEHTD